jgi:hypothetical protein
MLNLRCSAKCGFTQLCLIACPNNLVLDQDETLQYSSSPILSDETEPLAAEFATEWVPLPREGDSPENS